MTSVNDLLVKMIKWIELFKDLSDEDILELANNFNLQFYPSWSVIIKEWQKPDSIYILKNWSLEAKKAHGMSSIVLWNVNPWEIFGEMSYLKWWNSMASVVASEDCDVWQISVDDFDKFVKTQPWVMDTIYATMQKRQENNENINFSSAKDLNEDDDIKINL